MLARRQLDGWKVTDLDPQIFINRRLSRDYSSEKHFNHIPDPFAKREFAEIDAPFEATPTVLSLLQNSDS